MQALQAPLLSHTWFGPHDVPALTLSPVSLHVDTPVAQDVAPTWHAFDGVQVAPAAQALQPPLPSQTWLVPHDVPAVVFDVLVQVATPVEQSMAPVAHPPFSEHVAP